MTRPPGRPRGRPSRKTTIYLWDESLEMAKALNLTGKISVVVNKLLFEYLKARMEPTIENRKAELNAQLEEVQSQLASLGAVEIQMQREEEAQAKEEAQCMEKWASLFEAFEDSQEDMYGPIFKNKLESPDYGTYSYETIKNKFLEWKGQRCGQC